MFIFVCSPSKREKQVFFFETKTTNQQLQQLRRNSWLALLLENTWGKVQVKTTVAFKIPQKKR